VKNPRAWQAIATEAGVRLTFAELRCAGSLLIALGNHYGISKTQRRTFLFLLSRNPDYTEALETILGLIGSQGESPQRVARAGLEWLDEMLNEYHARHMERALRRLVAMGLDAVQIAETLNDAGLDGLFNGRQPFGEWHVRKACKKLGLKPRPVRWR
jgi:hypothetical protein